MHYGKGQAYDQEEFSGMFGEKQGDYNGGVQEEQGGLGQLLIMLLMEVLGGGKQGQATSLPREMGSGTVGDISGSGGIPTHRFPALTSTRPPYQVPDAMQLLQELIDRAPDPWESPNFRGQPRPVAGGK